MSVAMTIQQGGDTRCNEGEREFVRCNDSRFASDAGYGCRLAGVVWPVSFGVTQYTTNRPRLQDETRIRHAIPPLCTRLDTDLCLVLRMRRMIISVTGQRYGSGPATDALFLRTPVRRGQSMPIEDCRQGLGDHGCRFDPHVLMPMMRMPVRHVTVRALGHRVACYEICQSESRWHELRRCAPNGLAPLLRV